jgi:hypothetical protein
MVFQLLYKQHTWIHDAILSHNLWDPPEKAITLAVTAPWSFSPLKLLAWIDW